MSSWPRAPYIKSKNFDPAPVVTRGIPKYADSKYNPKVKGTYDWQKYWEEQLYYIHNGYETGGMWIPGRYYYFMNFRTFNTVVGPIRPQMLDLHLELAFIIEYCKANGKNFIAPKGRRLGLSEAGQTMIVDYGWRFMPGYTAGVAAGQDIYVQDFMQKWSDANAMTVPELKIKTLIDNSEETVAGYKWIDAEGNRIEDGTKNIIYKRTMFNNPHLFKGLKLNDIIAEEMGEFEHAKEFYSASVDCLKFGSVQKGSLFAYGCVCAGTKVWTNSGDLINIEDLTPELGIVGYDGKGASKEVITYWQPPFEKPCYRITTNSFRVLECSDDHPILSSRAGMNKIGEGARVNGKRVRIREGKRFRFKEAKNLVVGDQVAILESVPFFGEKKMWEPRLVGWLIGDGTYGKDHSPRMANCDPEINNFLLKKFDAKVTKSHITKTGKIYEEIRIKGICCKLREIGIYGQTKQGKRLPLNIHSYSKASICEMLGGLFDTDGCISLRKPGGRGAHCLSLTSSVFELLDEVRMLLQKIGVHCTIVKIKPDVRKNKKNKNYCYRLCIAGEKSVRMFYENVSFSIKYKQENIKAAVDSYKKEPRKRTDFSGLKTERVVSVEYIGMKPVYNLTAGTTNTYVANGIVTHNTGGSMGDSSEAFKDMWHNYEDYNAVRLFIPRTKFFFPYYGGASEDGAVVEVVPNLQHLHPWERIGIPDEEAAKEFILAERKRLLAMGDMEKYYDFCKNTPLDITEVFKKTVTNHFNIEALNAQGFKIEGSPKKYGKWKLEWVKNDKGEVVHPRKVVASPAKDDDLEDECVLILHDGHPAKGYRGLFVAGIDSYDQHQSKTSKSLGAMVVVRRGNPNPAMQNKQVVCLVRTRPRRKEIFYETCEKVAVYYSLYGNSLVDVGKPGIIQHFKDAGLESYLAKRPKKFESANSTQAHDYGVSINGYSKPLMNSLLQSYFDDYTDTLWFSVMIDEANNYDEVEIGSDNDSIDALGIALMQDVSDATEPFSQDDKKLEDAYAYPEHEFDADGDIVPAGNKDKTKDAFDGDINITRGTHYDPSMQDEGWPEENWEA